MVSTLIEFRQRLAAFEMIGSRETRIHALTDGYNGDIDPSFSPRGDRLVFSSSRTGSRSLWSANADGTNQRPLTSGTAFDERPAFSPDGQRIVFVSDRGGRRSIWVMNADGGAARWIVNAQVLDTPTWSPDGQHVVYSTPAGDKPGLWIASVADGSVRRLATRGSATAPAWSPRNDVIAYVEARPPAPGVPTSSRILFVDSVGRPLSIELPEYPDVFGGILAWAPDGRHLAAVIVPGMTSAAIWILDTKGREPSRRVTELPRGALVRGATWSADSSRLVVGQIERNGHIVLFER